jgi:NAD(P)-dependent dehydrogenase (short-subunit alcohol dehydrogenase family)
VKNTAFEKPLEEFRRTLEVNLTGTFCCSRHVAAKMAASGGGSIINVSSMSAFVANYPQGLADYQASKGGLEALKNQLASEWAADGIRVNNINPGYVDTDILLDDEELRRIWKSEMLIDEFAESDDIAPLAVYLASDASTYVTGASVLIDGGYTVR